MTPNARTHQKISLTLDGTSLMPSTATHFLHLWHLPSMSCAFSCLPAFARVTVRKAVGGENGRPVIAEMPKQTEYATGIRGEGSIPCAYCMW